MIYEYQDPQNPYGDTHKVYFMKDMVIWYGADSTYNLTMFNAEPVYYEDGTFMFRQDEKYGDATINFVRPSDGNCAFVDTKHFPGIVDLIVNSGIGELTGRTEHYGYYGSWMYPEVRFYEWFLDSCPDM